MYTVKGREGTGRYRSRQEHIQLSVVFILPKFTNKHTIAILIAACLSLCSLSFKILLVLLLLAIASM